MLRPSEPNHQMLRRWRAVATLTILLCAPYLMGADYAVGDSPLEGFVVTHVETHSEYRRFTIEGPTAEWVIEVTFSGGEGRWQTENYRVWPAPGQTQVHEALYDAVWRRCQELDELDSEPLVRTGNRFRWRPESDPVWPLFGLGLLVALLAWRRWRVRGERSPGWLGGGSLRGAWPLPVAVGLLFARSLTLGIATSLVVGPWFLGVVFGRMTRVEGRIGRALIALGWVTGSIAAGFGVWLLVPQFLVWDLLWASGLFGLTAGVESASRRPDGRRWAVVFGATVLSLTMAEGAVRLLLPAPPVRPAAHAPRLIFEHEAWHGPCQMLYPSLFEAELPSPGSGELPLVWHVGDSMVAGTGYEPFVQVLDQANPAVEHVNLGVPGTGPDYQYALLDAWLEVGRPDLIALYPYPGNDVQNVGAPFACCDRGPLLEAGPDGPQRRCEEPIWREPLVNVLGQSPAPYVLRAASGASSLATHLNIGFRRITAALFEFSREALPEEDNSGLFPEVVRALYRLQEESQVPFVVVVVPDRRAMEGVESPGENPSHAFVTRTFEEAGFAVYQPWDAIARAEFEDLWAPQDVHFGQGGHDLMADWLTPIVHEHLFSNSEGLAPDQPQRQ